MMIGNTDRLTCCPTPATRQSLPAGRSQLRTNNRGRLLYYSGYRASIFTSALAGLVGTGQLVANIKYPPNNWQVSLLFILNKLIFKTN